MVIEVRRKCTRCRIIKDSDSMHYNKQMGWMCNNRLACTETLNTLELQELINSHEEPKDAPIYYLERTKKFFDIPLSRQVYFVACKKALRRWHPKLAYILDNPPLRAERIKSISDIDNLISKLKSEGIR